MAYAVGDTVQVRYATPPGHVRTPYYCRGHAGVVERVCGRFHNPEELAYGRAGEDLLTLYRVRFRQRDLWPDYSGPETDTVEIELYEHWLEQPR
ncbi:MAG: nitrile hydratase subunit beta [Alphaproteobacteria bacterium]|jgi:nitrile hydratase|uniref:SH3-like domain-containing protein n=1 Tax=Pacificispira sp. TaxID=2888761 RepID=UPI001B08500B|nr:nitrile hydratase subunit beta [Alphaproteobacteria bacterium]MBO6861431.1 nitrile hydratase subunit beta [Alphaproteobacteria bacterium]MEC9268708.1 SH3-like domain-containing protein [Pseudomonadota bacterium]